MIITLHGSNHFSLQQRLQELVSAFIKEHGDMGLSRLDGEDASYEQIQEAILSLPFLSPKKLVILRQASLNKTFIERAESLLPQIDESTDVILVELKLDKRQSYYKTLKKITQFESFDELEGPALAQWLVKTAKAQNGSMSQSAAQSLIRRVGANQQLLFQELQKLVHYQPEVSETSIKLLTEPTPQSSIFDLIEAAVQGRGRQAMTLYDEQRLARVEPPQIIAMFTWQLQILAVIQSAGRRTPAEIAKEAGVARLREY